MRPADIEVHRTRNTPKCATVVLLDMSGSMRYDGLYIDVKRMGLALEGLIRREYPGDYLQFVELSSFAKPRHISEIPALLPKPVTVTSPVVRLRADMSDPKITELDVPPHFTNIQHGLQMARRFLAAQDTPNRQVILITDGLPTAHFEGQHLYLLYPPDPSTEQATMREGMLAQREGITINIFLLSTWMQSREDVQFAYRLAQTTAGRVFFTAGKDLDRYVVWDYLQPSPRRCRLVPVQVREPGWRYPVLSEWPGGIRRNSSFGQTETRRSPAGHSATADRLHFAGEPQSIRSSDEQAATGFCRESAGVSGTSDCAPGLTGAIQ